MGGRNIIICMLVIASGLAALGPLFVESAAETTYTTFDVGSGKDYSTIQSAINAASAGDVIRIHNGTYYENVIVNKTLTIVGEGADSTIINGSGISFAMKVLSDNSRIMGLAFTASGIEEDWEKGGHAGLSIMANNTIIQNCTFYGNYFGVLLSGGDHNKLVYSEAYENDVHGIGFGRYSTIQGCRSFDNNGSGFWAFVNPWSHFERCISEENGYMGFQLDHTENTFVKDFIARNNSEYGINLGGGAVGYRNYLENSLLENNGKGGLLVYNVEGPIGIMNSTIRGNHGPGINFSYGYFGPGFEVGGNLIEDNWEYGVQILSDFQNIEVFRNDFINNNNGSTQAFDGNVGNSWDMPGQTHNWGDWTWEQSPYGNHWDDWTIPDTDSNGVVDNPYSLDGGVSQQDDSPLVNRVMSSAAHLLSDDLWENGNFYVDFGITFPEPPVDDDDDDVDPPIDDDDDVDPPIDDDDDVDPPIDDDDIEPDYEGVPDIEFQEEPYREGSDQEVRIPEDFLQINEDIDYDWYIEGYGYVGRGESIDLNLPAGTYNLTLVGRNSDDGDEVFSISRELLVRSLTNEENGLLEKILKNEFTWIISITSLILIIIILGFVLGRKRKSGKEQPTMIKTTETIPQPRISRLPEPSGRSFVPTEEVIAGKLEDVTPVGQYREIGSEEALTPVTDDIEYEEMKALNEAIDIVKDANNEGTSLERSRAKLEEKYREGALGEDDYRELSEILDKYMR